MRACARPIRNPMTPNSVTVECAQPCDIEGFLSLHRSVFSAGIESREWFRWKYENLSRLADLPVVVAKDDERVVGAIGYLGLTFKSGDNEILGIQPVDVMVDPEYRDQNLFLRLVRTGRSELYPGDDYVEFGWPNSDTIDVWTRLQGWDVLNEQTRKFRIQNPSRWLASSGRWSQIEPVTRLIDLPFRAYLSVTDRQRSLSVDGFGVTRHDDPPSDILESLYRDSIPDEIHLRRDAAFYSDRLTAPHNDYPVYVAYETGEPVAAIVVSDAVNESWIRLIDVLPINRSRISPLIAILQKVLADYRRSAGVEATSVLPRELIEKFGFNSADSVKRIASHRYTPSALSSIVPEFGTFRFCVRGENIEQVPSNVTEFSEWHISGIEKDST